MKQGQFQDRWIVRKEEIFTTFDKLVAGNSPESCKQDVSICKQDVVASGPPYRS